MQSKDQNALNTPHYSKLTQAILGALTLVSTSTIANETDAEESTAKKEGLEVIQVTAQKRVESIQDVPIAITAFGDADIEKMGIQNANDLGLLTPGLETNNATATQTTFNIRGITTNDMGIGLDAAVAVYIDGVYVGRRGSSNINFNDVERVEVLKGPQGTLFGRNAAAGAIHIITKKPAGDDEGMVKFTIGNYNKRKIEMSADLKINEDWSFRGGFNSNYRGGYLDVVDSKERYGTQEDWSIRGSWLWNKNADTEVIIRADFNDTNQQGRPAVTLNTSFGSGDPFAPIEYDFEGLETREAYGASVEVNHDMGDMTFTSISGFRAFERYNAMEDDGSAFTRAYFESILIEDQTQLSQEFRLVGSHGDLKWTAGSTFYYEDIKQDVVATFNTLSFDSLAVVQLGLDPRIVPDFPFGQGVTGAYMTLGPLEAQQVIGREIQRRMMAGESFESAQAAVGNELVNANITRLFGQHTETFEHSATTTSVALYFDGTYAVTDKLDVTLGGRFTYDDKEFSLFSAPQNFFTVPYENLGEVPLAVAFQPEQAEQEESWSKFTPRFVIDYKWTDSFMTYASYAEGFKSGGFNGLGEAPPVKEETVKNTEIGFKSSWFDNRFRLNASVFDYEYTNLQQLELFGSPVPTYNLRNVDAEGDGYDVEMVWQVTPDLILTANHGKTIAEYTKWDFFPGEDQSDSRVGEPISGMPEGQSNVRLDYFFEGLNGQWNFHVSWAKTGERTQGVEGPELAVMPFEPGSVTGINPNGRISGYSLVNTRLSWQSDNHPIFVAAYISNATDEKYLIQTGGQAMALGSPIATPALPRMFGFEFGMEF